MTKPERRLPTRKDAVANRERLLVGAEEYFAELGIDAPLHGLADRVGVGIGTVYRNFPAHADLIRALYDRIVDRFDKIAEQCADQPSGWDAIETLIRRSVQMLVENPATAAVMRRQDQNDPEYQPGNKWSGPIHDYVERAKAEGMLREDATPADIASIPFALSSVQNLPFEKRREVAERLTTLMLDGLRVHPHDPAPLGTSPINTREQHDLVQAIKV
ncbi:TetR/AcrR family transcriptional regulator [Aeromicrobium phragmitis]|uniref:TetR/AcrR family transcriptional regulator n=1 Tax=Aeromicrobium phragmitis TaxID=2478914 RepID=A0A3L8PPU5_9ACTN|nr:TetR family transcriptional regulator [Aeromicrobium phragmitis]RLV57350.1 TetR/AcrR family transcriptional regulator [Aeromicrobium phragmitis]